MEEKPIGCTILVGNPLGRHPLEEQEDGRIASRLFLRGHGEWELQRNYHTHVRTTHLE
jgi:hypothetical protein